MDKLVAICKICSDINRIKILALLKREKELCVCEICDTLELSQPLVSRHLKGMRDLDLVESNKKGKWIVYALKTNKIVEYLLKQVQDETKDLSKLVSCSRD